MAASWIHFDAIVQHPSRGFANGEGAGRPVEQIAERQEIVDWKSSTRGQYAVAVISSAAVGSRTIALLLELVGIACGSKRRRRGAANFVFVDRTSNPNVGRERGRGTATGIAVLVHRIRWAMQHRQRDTANGVAVLKGRRTVVAQPSGMRTIGGQVLKQRLLFKERQHAVVDRKSPAVVATSRGKLVVGIMVVVQCQPQLLHVVSALHASGSFASRLNGGQQQADQDANDCYDN